MNQPVKDFIASISDTAKRQDSLALAAIMQAETGQEPQMWGSSIIGFGTHHYKYESGREGDTIVVGFAPRKPALVLYGVIFYDQGGELLSELSTYKTGKGCLYIKRLADVKESVLRQMIKNAYHAKTS